MVIWALPAAQELVVNLQVFSGGTDLALPGVAAQYLFSEVVVGLGIKPHARLFGWDPAHKSFAVTSFRNACGCLAGRNLKKP